MADLSTLITEHQIAATNPFGDTHEADDAVLRMVKALEAVVETIESLEDQPPYGATGEEQHHMDAEMNVARSLREDITAALTDTKGEPR